MALHRPYADLDLEEDLALQRRVWRAQRVGWLLLGAVLLAALLGVFGGGGPCSDATATAPGLRVGYQRFLRLQHSAVLEVDVDPAPAGELTLRIDGDYLRRQQLETVLPRPVRTAVDGDGVRFTFATAGPRARVQFHLRPDAAGLLHCEVAAGDGPHARFTQFVHP